MTRARGRPNQCSLLVGSGRQSTITASTLKRPSHRKNRPAARMTGTASSCDRKTNPSRLVSPGNSGSSPISGRASNPSSGSVWDTMHGHPQPECAGVRRPPLAASYMCTSAVSCGVAVLTNSARPMLLRGQLPECPQLGVSCRSYVRASTPLIRSSKPQTSQMPPRMPIQAPGAYQRRSSITRRMGRRGRALAPKPASPAMRSACS